MTSRDCAIDDQAKGARGVDGGRMTNETKAGEPAAQSAPLSRRVGVGGAFFSAGFIGGQLIRLGSNLILTRLLAPEAFGLIAAAVSINVLAVMISDIGINSSIIRSPHSDDPRYLRTAWTMTVIRNAGLWGLICLIAAGLAYFQSLGALPQSSVFASASAPVIIAVVGAQVLIVGFGSTNAVIAERNLRLGPVVILTLVNQAVTSLTTISLAFAGFGVWAIAGGMLIGSAIGAVATHFVYPGPAMRFAFDREFAREIFTFGKWLLLASLFGFVTTKGDSLIFGWFMETATFGLYSIATVWLLAAIGVLDTVTRRLLFPAFSEVNRDRKHDLARVYKKSRLLLDGAAFALGLGGVFLAGPVLDFVYNDTFAASAEYLRLLMPMILLRPYTLLHNVILADGDSRNFTWVTFATGAATLILTPLSIHFFGAKAGVLVFASTSVVAAPLAIKYASKSMPIDLMTEARPAIVAAVTIFYLACF